MLKTWLQKNEKSISQATGADFVFHRASRYLSGLKSVLDIHLDKRLVSTFCSVFMIILTFRERKMGLLLSELGGYLCGHDHAPAGTKRISNLLRSENWDSTLVDDFLFAQAKARIESLLQAGKRPLLLWDESRIEKPESWFSEGLCSVESSKGKRLTKIKKGFYTPPAHRICVPGFHWTAALLSALGEVPSVCQMSWWTTRGKYKEHGSNIFFRMLQKLHQTVGQGVLHVLDRGYASAWTIEWMLYFKQDFLIRWKQNHLLKHTQKGTKKTHLLARSFKAVGRKCIYDKERNIHRFVTIAYAPVTHLDFPEKQLYLVIVRDRTAHQSPMYLLTSVPVESTKQAWQIAHSYMHRWNIEQAFRVGKAELGMESPRLWFWQNRLKLLALVTLVDDFLLSLIRNWADWMTLFIRNYCHRTGNRHKEVSMPIYRLRMAISNCLCKPCWHT